MADTHPLTDRELYEQRACASLVQHSGWREVVLPLVAQHLAATERTASRTDLPEGVRLGAVDQRHTLLWLLETVYKKADEPNPFDAARGALWSTVLPPRERDAPPDLEATLADTIRMALTPPVDLWERDSGRQERPRRSSGGSVA